MMGMRMRNERWVRRRERERSELRRRLREAVTVRTSWKDLEQLELATKPTSFLETVAAIRHNCPRFARLKVRGLIGKEDASAIAMCLPELKQLELSGSYLTKDELAVIMSGCWKQERLTVKDCLGFQADEELLRLASGIHSFEHEGSKLLDDNGYERDESEQQSGFFYL
ncbi:hypothetical protein BHE74_00028936 [Ensete ventricosum]|nr:hypothetical protein BHE74_00028936 [Ensete ventricosum]